MKTKIRSGAVSTTRELKRLLRKGSEEPDMLSAALRAACGSMSREALCNFIVSYYNDGPSESLTYRLLSSVGELSSGVEYEDRTETVLRKSLAELHRHRVKFRSAVTWLCSAKESKPGASPNRMMKLLKAGKLEWGRYPHLDKSDERFLEYFEIHGLRHLKTRLSLQEGRLILAPRYYHLVDLFCAALVSQCRERKPSEVPFGLCPECQRLFYRSSQRMKAFCSRKCQWRHHWTAEKRRDDRYVKRLEELSTNSARRIRGFSAEDLSKRLAAAAVEQRLHTIAQRWTSEWPRLTQRSQALLAAWGNIHPSPEAGSAKTMPQKKHMGSQT
jgi:hypothetical protein